MSTPPENLRTRNYSNVEGQDEFGLACIRWEDQIAGHELDHGDKSKSEFVRDTRLTHKVRGARTSLLFSDFWLMRCLSPGLAFCSISFVLSHEERKYPSQDSMPNASHDPNGVAER